MYFVESEELAFCPYFHEAVELIGKRWTGVILRELMHGSVRFSDLRAAVPGLSDRLLSERLKELEAAGVQVHLWCAGNRVGEDGERTFAELDDFAETVDVAVVGLGN